MLSLLDLVCSKVTTDEMIFQDIGEPICRYQGEITGSIRDRYFSAHGVSTAFKRRIHFGTICVVQIADGVITCDHSVGYTYR